ncbi:MAG: hypothetical protein GX335_04590 [Firmicutes bacterium]|nr:hypothetical protein [Bacillota bacterium]
MEGRDCHELHLENAHYKVVDFAYIYTEWFNKRKDAEAKLRESSAYNELFKAKFNMIDKEFEYYENELTVLLEKLDTVKKERLRKILVELSKQHELLAIRYWESGVEPDILLDFFKEIPGKMRFILQTLTWEKRKEVEPPSNLIPAEHWFVEGKIDIKAEETGVAGLFWCRR